jgi:hypothetical protein
MEVCYADFSDLRCKSANFRSGEPFNKRSVFEQFDRSLEGSLEAAKVGDFTAINEKLHCHSSVLNERAADTSRNFSRIIEWAIPQLNAD